MRAVMESSLSSTRSFRVELKEDSITARIDGYDADILDEKLEVLGRLMMVSKQLDMVMLSEDAVEQYYQEFSQGHIPPCS